MALNLDAVAARAADYRRRFDAGQSTTLAYDICGIDIPALIARIVVLEGVLRDIRDWEKNLTPADGIKYGSYFPAFAISQVLDDAPLGGGKTSG